MKKVKVIFMAIATAAIIAAGVAIADPSNISTASGPRSCTATSGDGKKSCSVSCKENENADCSNTQTEAVCVCK